MKHRIELYRKVSRMVFEMLFVILLTIFFENVLFKSEPSVVNRVIVVLVYIGSFIIRNVSRMRITVLAFHVGFGFIIYQLPIALISRIMLMAVVCYLFISAMGYMAQGSKLKPLDDPPWPSFLFIFILYLFALYTKSHFFVDATYIVAVLMLVTYYLMTYIEGLKGYIDSAKDVQGLPLNKVIARNNIIVVCIIVLLVVCMTVGFMLDYSQLVSFIKQGIRAILKLVGSVFMIFSILLNHLVNNDISSAFSYTPDEQAALEKYGSNIGDSYMIILYIAVGIAAFIASVKLLRYVLRLLFARSKHSEDLVEVSESLKETREEKKDKKGIFAKLSYEDKLRKKYKKYIEGYRFHIGLTKYRTCRDIADEISAEQLGDVNDITEVYAQVRYGNTKVDKGLLRRFSGLFKK